MQGFVPWATPWWVNSLLLIPAVPLLLSQWERIGVGRLRLAVAALAGIAFGFVEAAAVVYLRAATGLWPGPPEKALTVFPAALLRIECMREAATLILLLGLAWLAGQNARQRVSAFLWAFAFWDASYYLWLRVTIGWPTSPLNMDVLFLIPVPWLAQVWFPLLVSGLTALAVALRD